LPRLRVRGYAGVLHAAVPTTDATGADMPELWAADTDHRATGGRG